MNVTLDISSDEAEEILIAFKIRRQQLKKLNRFYLEFDSLPNKLRKEFIEKFGWSKDAYKGDFGE